MKEVSKEEWFGSKLKKGFFIFEKNDYPRISQASYDPIIFYMANCAYQHRQKELFSMMEPFIFYDEEKKNFRMEWGDVKQFKEKLYSQAPLKDLKILGIGHKDPKFAECIRKLGADIKLIDLGEIGREKLALSSYKEVLGGEKFDIAISNGALNNSLRYGNFSGNFCALELYAIFAGMTRKNGHVIHINGNMLTTLFMVFFHLVGLDVIEYFRHSDGNDNFIMMMEKINSKEILSEEFRNIHDELKKRNPIRYA